MRPPRRRLELVYMYNAGLLGSIASSVLVSNKNVVRTIFTANQCASGREIVTSLLPSPHLSGVTKSSPYSEVLSPFRLNHLTPCYNYSEIVRSFFIPPSFIMRQIPERSTASSDAPDRLLDICYIFIPGHFLPLVRPGRQVNLGAYLKCPSSNRSWRTSFKPDQGLTRARKRP